MQRRSFLSGILAAGIAPAILSRSSIMGLWVPRNPADLIVFRRFVPWGPDGGLIAHDVSIPMDKYGVRGFISAVPWAPRKIIYNEHWMDHS